MTVGMWSTDGRHVARRTLDEEQVLAAAEALVDEIGWDALTMAALADRLDVRVPSLYSHVPSLESVRSELQQRAMAALGAELQAVAMGRSGEDALRAMADAFRSHALRHPHRYDGMTRRPVDRSGLQTAAAGADAALRAALRPFGLGEQPTFEAELSIFATAHGFVSLA